MAELIETSYADVAGVETSVRWRGGLTVALCHGWRRTLRAQAEIADVVEIDAETWRSAGGAVAGAVIGGLATGGIGLLAGAAFGGRRRRRRAYLVTFSDGGHVAFEERASAQLRVLEKLARATEVRRRAGPAESGRGAQDGGDDGQNSQVR